MTMNQMPPVRNIGKRPESLPEALSAILAGQQRIESKLDALLEALAADDEEETEEPVLDLSGRPVPGARDQGGAL